MDRALLTKQFSPELTQQQLSPEATERIEAAQQELIALAESTDDRCWGYFRREESLPASRRFAEKQPDITQGFSRYQQLFHFSWLRLSLGRDGGAPKYHLDANRATGLIEDSRLGDDLLPTKHVWRLLVNLHTTASRQFAYVNVPPQTLHLQKTAYSIELADDEELDAMEEQLLVIPPREGRRVWVAKVCVSRVLHAGIETPEGHFLGSWTREEAA